VHMRSDTLAPISTGHGLLIAKIPSGSYSRKMEDVLKPPSRIF